MNEKIIVEIDSFGAIKAEATGFVGQACQAETQKIFATLGGQQKSKPKPEFFESTGTAAVDQLLRM